MKKLFILCCFITLCACDGLDEALETDKAEFEVTVIDTQFCNLVLIEFKIEDTDEVARISGVESSRYYALNLNKVLVHPGQHLLVQIRKITEEEYIACPTFVPTYPAIVLLSLKILS